MCKSKSSKKKKSKSVHQQIYDNYIDFGSEYLSAKSEKHRELYRELISTENFEKAKKSIGHSEIIKEAKLQKRSCQIEKPCTQTAVDITLMCLCLVILCIQFKFFFEYKTGKMAEVRGFILKQFGDPNIEAKNCKNMMQRIVKMTTCEVILGKKLASKSLRLLSLQIMKAIYVFVVRAFNGQLANSQLYTHSIFIYRAFYDIFFVLLSFKYLADLDNVLNLPYQLSILPLILELIIFRFSVMPAIRNTQKVRYRILRARIKTRRQNDEMWSTDEDSDLEELLEQRDDTRVDWYLDLQSKFNDSSSEEEKTGHHTKIEEADAIIKGTPTQEYNLTIQRSDGQFDGSKVDNQVLNTSRTTKSSKSLRRRSTIKLDTSYDQDSVDAPKWKKCCQKNITEQFDPRIGPFDVFLTKMHKPAFICFIDLMMSVTFFIVSSTFFISRLDEDMQTNVENGGFIPKGIFFLQVMQFLKFNLDKFFLSKEICTSKKMRNRSITAIRLFRVRLFFDAIVLAIYLRFFMVQDTKNHNVQTLNFRTFYVLGSILMIEFFIYKFCIVPAQERCAYQKVSIERFKQNKLVWLKGRADPSQHRKKINKFVEKVQKSIDNDNKIAQILELNKNEYGIKQKLLVPDQFQTISNRMEEEQSQEQLIEQATHVMIPLIVCSKSLACLITFLNVVIPSSGTLFAAFADQRKSINVKVFFMFLIQALILGVAWWLNPTSSESDTNDDEVETSADNSDIATMLGYFVWIWGIVYGLIIHQYNNILMQPLEGLYIE